MKKTKSLGPSNDKVSEDEITLAELIQNAAARGLYSCRGKLFDVDHPMFLGVLGGWARLQEAPKGARRCCALGAQLLTPQVTNPILDNACVGNDISDYDSADWDRGKNIAAAFEQALRPDGE